MLPMHAATSHEQIDMHTLSILWGTDVSASTLRPGFMWKTGNFETLQTVTLQQRHVRDRNFPLRQNAILSDYKAKRIFGPSVRLPDEMNQALTFTYQWVAPDGFDPSEFDVQARVRKVRNDYMEVVRSRYQNISAQSLATDDDEISEPIIRPNQLLPCPKDGLQVPGRPIRKRKFRGSMAEPNSDDGEITTDSEGESNEDQMMDDSDHNDYETEPEEDEDEQD